MKPATKATLGLFVTTVTWGWTFVWMKEVLEAANRIVPDFSPWVIIGLYTSIRFGLASLIVPFTVPGSTRGLDAATWKAGGILGAVLFFGFVLQILGLGQVSAPVSAFLTSLYVVFTILLGMGLHRRMPGPTLIAGALLATFGASFISGPPQVSMGVGEGLTILCAVFFAIHILVIDAYTKRFEPSTMTFTSFVVMTLGSIATFVWAWNQQADPNTALLLEFLKDPDFLRPTILSSLLGTVLALGLMNQFQRHLPPVRAAILYATEPVWTTIIAIGLGMTDPDFWLWVGGGAVLMGNVIAELRPRRHAEQEPETESVS